MKLLKLLALLEWNQKGINYQVQMEKNMFIYAVLLIYKEMEMYSLDKVKILLLQKII